MNETAQIIIVFMTIALACALVWHTFIKRIPLAILASAISTAVAFQIYHFSVFGPLDSFAIVIFISSFATAFIIALLVAIPFRVWRGKQTKTNSETPPDT